MPQVTDIVGPDRPTDTALKTPAVFFVLLKDLNVAPEALGSVMPTGRTRSDLLSALTPSGLSHTGPAAGSRFRHYRRCRSYLPGRCQGPGSQIGGQRVGAIPQPHKRDRDDHRGRRSRDHRVALDVLDDSDRYTHASTTGHVEEMPEDTDLPGIGRLAQQHMGKPYPQRDRRRSALGSP